jgi:hypothetical protein
MKEFIFSVLSNLGGNIRISFVRCLSLFFGEDSSAVHLQLQKPQQEKTVSVSANNSRRHSSPTPTYNLRSKVQLNVVKIAFFLREPIHVTAKVLVKNRAFLGTVESLRNTEEQLPPSLPSAFKSPSTTKFESC